MTDIPDEIRQCSANFAERQDAKRHDVPAGLTHGEAEREEAKAWNPTHDDDDIAQIRALSRENTRLVIERNLANDAHEAAELRIVQLREELALREVDDRTWDRAKDEMAQLRGENTKLREELAAEREANRVIWGADVSGMRGVVACRRAPRGSVRGVARSTAGADVTRDDWQRRRGFIEAQQRLHERNGSKPWDARIAGAKDWEALQTFIHLKPVQL